MNKVEPSIRHHFKTRWKMILFITCIVWIIWWVLGVFEQEDLIITPSIMYFMSFSGYMVEAFLNHGKVDDF